MGVEPTVTVENLNKQGRALEIASETVSSLATSAFLEHRCRDGLHQEAFIDNPNNWILPNIFTFVREPEPAVKVINGDHPELRVEDRLLDLHPKYNPGRNETFLSHFGLFWHEDRRYISEERRAVVTLAACSLLVAAKPINDKFTRFYHTTSKPEDMKQVLGYGPSSFNGPGTIIAYEEHGPEVLGDEIKKEQVRVFPSVFNAIRAKSHETSKYAEERKNVARIRHGVLQILRGIENWGSLDSETRSVIVDQTCDLAESTFAVLGDSYESARSRIMGLLETKQRKQRRREGHPDPVEKYDDYIQAISRLTKLISSIDTFSRFAKDDDLTLVNLVTHASVAFEQFACATELAANSKFLDQEPAYKDQSECLESELKSFLARHGLHAKALCEIEVRPLVSYRFAIEKKLEAFSLQYGESEVDDARCHLNAINGICRMFAAQELYEQGLITLSVEGDLEKAKNLFGKSRKILGGIPVMNTSEKLVSGVAALNGRVNNVLIAANRVDDPLYRGKPEEVTIESLKSIAKDINFESVALEVARED